MDFLSNTLWQLMEDIIKNTDLLLMTAPTVLAGYEIKMIADMKEIKKENKNMRLFLQRKMANTTKIPKIYAKFDKENTNKILKIWESTPYPPELEDIIETFKEKVSPENYINCINNMRSVDIKKLNLIEDSEEYIENTFSNRLDGYYEASSNQITIIKDAKHVLSHEFLHMASTSYDSSGFQVLTRFDTYMGRGLNEGYTELLNHRIFGSKSLSYYDNVKIARILENFFDNKEDMTRAYFTNDIDNVYFNFMRYGSKYEFLEIMENLDNLAQSRSITENLIISTKTKLKLYDIIKRSKDNEKIKNVENILNENTITRILSSGKKFVLNSAKSFRRKL